MGILSSFRDLFEIGRKTTTEVKSNKIEKRNYKFEDGDKMPSSKKEYNESKRKTKDTKTKRLEDDELDR